MNENEIFDEFKNTVGAKEFDRIEENVRDGTFDLSPTPDESIISAAEFIWDKFETWRLEHFPDVEVSYGADGYPESLTRYLESIFS